MLAGLLPLRSWRVDIRSTSPLDFASMGTVKFVDRGAGIIEGLAIPYGGPMDGRDLDGEAFDKNTALGDLYGVDSPVIYNHGIDDTLGYTRIGSSTKISRRDDGRVAPEPA